MFVTCSIKIEYLNGRSSYPGEPKFLKIKDSMHGGRVVIETPDDQTFEVDTAELDRAIRAANT